MKHLLRFKQLSNWGLVVVAAQTFVFHSVASEQNPLRDPTQPDNFQIVYSQNDVEEVKDEVTLSLQAVYAGKEKNRVLINGLVLQKGDSVEGYVVRSISPYRVELEGADTAQILTLFVETVKK